MPRMPRLDPSVVPHHAMTKPGELREDEMNDGGGVRRIEITERESPVFASAVLATWVPMNACTAAYCELDPTHAFECWHRQPR